MSFQHGVYIQELDTKVLAVRTCDSALPFVVGLSPVQNLAGEKPINSARLISSYTQFVTEFGGLQGEQSEEDYTLFQFAKVYFSLYGMTPVVFVNVFDPAVHKDGQDQPDPSLVTDDDIIGGVDADTGARTGLELIEEVFSSFGKVVGLVLAPGFSDQSTVANALIAKAENINGFFKAMAYLDCPAGLTKVADAVAHKINYGSPHAVMLYPQVNYGDYAHWLSVHAAGLTAKVDEGNANVPYESPSNKELRIDSPKQILAIQDANYLNEQGLATVFRFSTGWKLWGNRTAAFPEVTDIKDAFIPCRRMANWIENNLVLNTWQKVDDPVNKRLIETVVSTMNIWLNGLVGRSYLLGAKVYFRAEDNPVTDLANGIIRFYITYLSPPPAETIEYVLEVDTSYFSNLF